MSQNTGISWLNLTANGNIRPSRVVTGVTGAGNALKAIEAAVGGTIPPLGISGENTRYVPGSASDDGYNAIAGEPVRIAGPGQVANGVAGAAITAGELPLTFDNQGRVISLPAATGSTNRGRFWCIGWPRNTALAAGDKVEVAVTFPFPIDQFIS